MSFFIILAIVAGVVAYRVTSAEQRKDFYAAALGLLRELRTAAAKPRPEYDDFRAALRARMRFPLATPAIAAIVAIVFARMQLDARAIGDDTLLAWGASLGTRTTNGEWWRLATSVFVHAGMLHVLFDLAALIQLGLILERLVGRLTIVAVYLFAGVFDALVNLSSRPLAVTISASGAVFGLYGLLLAVLLWQTFHNWRRREQDPEHPRLNIPPIAMRRLAIVGAVFALYSLFSGRAHVPEFTAMLVGMMYGVIFARRACERTPRPAFVGAAAFTTAAVTAVAAVVIGVVTDVKPELARVLDVERRTAGTYQSELDALKRGRITPDALAHIAENEIVSELQAADDRLKSLSNVPAEHQPAVADAREFLRLRCASWRARGASIRRGHAQRPQKPDTADDTAWRLQLHARFRSDEAARANAEAAERASHEALQRVERFLHGGAAHAT